MKNLFDIHCHIIPGVDDGARTMEMALKMLQMEYEDGVRSIILTPHYRREMFETPKEKIERQFALLKEKSEATIGSDLRLYLGCEFHANMSMVETLSSRERPTMAGSEYVLTEFSQATDFSFARERIYDLVSHGFIPIVAHVEQYPQIRKDFEKLRAYWAAHPVDGYFYQDVTTDPGYSVKITKIRKNGTAFVEPQLKDCDMHHGMFVDIFVLDDYVKNNFLSCYSTEYLN